MELFKAHKQWATRPADETFESVEALHAACAGYRASAATAKVAIDTLRVEAMGDDLQLVGRTGVPAKLTNWSFGQLCTRASAPASYLRNLPPTLAAQNVNHGLAQASKNAQGDDKSASLMFHKNGGLVLRAATSEAYARIWNCDITERLLGLVREQPNWKLPMGYVRNEREGFSGIVDGSMAPRGAYASDHDMFCFLVDEQRKITAKGAPEGINRGFFVWNSEVGASSFGIMTFLYDMVCGNNIVWGASQVSEMRIRHVGDASPKAFRKLSVEVRKFAESSVSDIEAKIENARNCIIGATKDEVLDRLLGKRIPELSRKRLSEAYDAAEVAGRYGSPRSVWGMVNGITEISQHSGHTDSRVALDRAAGKVLEFVF